MKQGHFFLNHATTQQKRGRASSPVPMLPDPALLATQARGGASSSLCDVQRGAGPAQHSAQISTWPQVAAQTRDIPMAVVDNMGHGHGHRPFCCRAMDSDLRWHRLLKSDSHHHPRVSSSASPPTAQTILLLFLSCTSTTHSQWYPLMSFWCLLPTLTAEQQACLSRHTLDVLKKHLCAQVYVWLVRKL